MITNNASELKIERSGTEYYVSGKVLKTLSHAEDVKALGEMMDKARLQAREILLGAIEAYFNCYFVDDPDWDKYAYSMDCHREGNIGLEKCLSEISDTLRFEYLRLKQHENRIES